MSMECFSVKVLCIEHEAIWKESVIFYFNQARFELFQCSFPQCHKNFRKLAVLPLSCSTLQVFIQQKVMVESFVWYFL